MIVVAILLMNLALILAAAGIRFPASVRVHTSPVPIPPDQWWTVVAGLLAVATILGIKGWRQLPAGPARAAAIRVWGLFSALFLSGWGFLSPSGFGPADVVVLVLLALGLAASFANDLRHHRALGLGRANFVQALRWLAAPTLLVLAALYVFRAAPEADAEDSTPIVVALLTYPAYALIQILVFQTFLVRDLQRMRRGPIAIVGTTSLLFALVHWPNPVVMGACLLGMAGWTAVYLRAPNVYAVAISMGLTAAALAQWAPQDLTHHMRVGPNYAVTRARHEREAARARLVDHYADDAYFRAAGGTLEGWVRALYRDLLERAPTSGEVAGWVGTLEREYRAYVARQFHNSDEYRARHPEVPLRELQEIDLLRRDFRPDAPGYEHLRPLLSDQAFHQAGGAFHPWLRLVYQTLLERTPSDVELQAWPAVPKLEQRRHVVEEFLTLRRYHGLPAPTP